MRLTAEGLLIGLLALGQLGIAADEPAPRAPSVLVLEVNPAPASPAPHEINFRWLVEDDAEGYGWEVERSQGTGPSELRWQLPPGLTFPGDLANVIDSETPPGVEACFRARAVAPGRPPSDWSAKACADAGVPPPAVSLAVSLRPVANGLEVSWNALSGTDAGYLAEVSTERQDGLRAWLGTGLTPAGIGRLTAFAPVAALPARWCAHVLPVRRDAVNRVVSEEFCADVAALPAEPSPTPRAPAVGNSTETGAAAGRAAVAVLLALAGLVVSASVAVRYRTSGSNSSR